MHVPRPQTLGISGCARRCLEPWKMPWQGWSPWPILITSTQPWNWPEGLEETGDFLKRDQIKWIRGLGTAILNMIRV